MDNPVQVFHKYDLDKILANICVDVDVCLNNKFIISICKVILWAFLLIVCQELPMMVFLCTGHAVCLML